MNVVLDLDETLVSVTTTRPTGYNFKFLIGDNYYYVRKRPNLDLFLEYVFKKFNTVSVWTAATEEYARNVVKGIFTPLQRKNLAFLLSRKDLATRINDKTFIKPLSKIFKNNKFGITAENTLMIDDKASVTSNNAGNAIIVPAWKGSPKDKNLVKLMIIMDFMLRNKDIFKFDTYQKAFYLKNLCK